MNLTFETSGSQIDGARDYQEDAFLITNLSDKTDKESTSLVVCADGMGGHAAGNVASNMAIQAFNRHFATHHDKQELFEVMNDGVLKANESIAETVKETSALKGMGCTFVSAYFEHDHLWWVSVGDSHLYLLRNGELKKKNADHSYGGFLDRMAALGKPSEPEPGFARNMLMSALTGEEIADIDCPHSPLELQAGDRVIISSDGLDTLSPGKIIHYSNESKTAKECVDNLLQAVIDAAMPRQDNTTVIVIDVIDKNAPPVEEVEEAIEEIVMEDEFDGDSTQPNQMAPDIDLFAVPEDEPAEKSGGKTGLIIGIVVVALLAAGGAFMFMGGEEKPKPAIELEPVEETKPAPVTQAEKPAPVEPAPAATTTETQAPAEPVAAPEPAPAPAPVPVPAPKPAAKSTGTFQDSLKSGGKGPTMVWLPAGQFEMGSGSNRPEFEERPKHTVTIDRIAISQYEVSFAEYDAFANATGRSLPDNMYLEKDTHPVVNISWDDALAYTKWLSKQTGQKYRLPSEAEWEYAARGGTTDHYWWGSKIGKNNAHCFACGSPYNPRQPTKRGQFNANPFGLYDTSGNVLEWVYDCFHENYEGAPTDGSVWEGGDCSVRVIRGGSFTSAPPSLRNAKRDSFPANGTYDNVGFRVVREP